MSASPVWEPFRAGAKPVVEAEIDHRQGGDDDQKAHGERVRYVTQKISRRGTQDGLIAEAEIKIGEIGQLAVCCDEDQVPDQEKGPGPKKSRIPRRSAATPSKGLFNARSSNIFASTAGAA